MSRKSRGNKQKSKQVDAAPEEILADGTGPVDAVELAPDAGEAVVHVGIDEVASGPDELAAAAKEVGRRRGKPRKDAAAELPEPDEHALPVDLEAAASDGDADPAGSVEAVTAASDATALEDAATEGVGGVGGVDGVDGFDGFDGIDGVDGDGIDGVDGGGAAFECASEPGAEPTFDRDADPHDAAEVLLARDVAVEDMVEGAAGADGADDGGHEDDDDIGVALPKSAASMDAVQLKHLVEALVFASDKPMTVQRLRQLTRVSDSRRLEQALVDLAADYAERGLVLQQVSGGYQFRTRTQFSAWVQQLIAGRPVRLSRAQLETLAIIAYRQPITRPEIDDIRGVDSSGTLKMLMDRTLIRILGKREEVGRPMLYGTTKEFLDFFSLSDLRELPTLREYSELTDESRQVMSDRLGVGLDGSDPERGGSDPDDSSGGGSGSGGGGSGGPTGDAEPEGRLDESSPSTLDELLASYSDSMPEVSEVAPVADVPLTDLAAPGEVWSDAVDDGEAASDPGSEAVGEPRVEARDALDGADDAIPEHLDAARDAGSAEPERDAADAGADELAESDDATPAIELEVRANADLSAASGVASATSSGWPEGSGPIGEPRDDNDDDDSDHKPMAASTEIDPALVVEAQAGPDPAVEQSTE